MYGIICNARKGKGLGVGVLALVDRSRSKRLWWTSDNANIAICYRSRSAADFAARRLKKNAVRVVEFRDVQRLLADQARNISEVEREREHQSILNEMDQGWDAHKSY